jgi:hypothetical protein
MIKILKEKIEEAEIIFNEQKIKNSNISTISMP